MSSLLSLKRENFRKNIRQNAHEKIFKLKRIPQLSKEEMKILIQQNDTDSINKLCDATVGDREQTKFLIEIGGIHYFQDILINNSHNKESAIIGLGNLCQDKSILEDVYELNLVEFMLKEVHRYKNIDQLVLKLWFLGVLAKFDSDYFNYDELDQVRSKIFSVFMMYQLKYLDIISVQEECFYGFYQLSKVTYFQDDLMQLCCKNLNKGYDESIISTIYYLLNDNVQYVVELHESSFMENCHLHLQMKSRQKHVLQILYYYSQYYVEEIINNKKIVQQILQIQNNQQYEQEIILLHYSMLFYSPTALVMKIVSEFDVTQFLKNVLREFQYEQKILCLIALLQQIKQELITELIPLLEKIMLEKNISLSTTKKIKILIG